MIILCDSREKSPLIFSHPYVEGDNEVCHLPYGDYTARLKDDHVIPIYFERKSIPDALHTFSKDIKRFFKEIKRCKDAGSELIIIIEGTVTDLLKGSKFSKVQGLQILRTLLTLWHKYKIISVFCKDRAELSLFISEFYLSYARQRNKSILK